MKNNESFSQICKQNNLQGERMDQLINRFIAIGAEAKQLRRNHSGLDCARLRLLRLTARSVFAQILQEANILDALEGRCGFFAANAVETFLDMDVPRERLAASPEMSANANPSNRA